MINTVLNYLAVAIIGSLITFVTSKVRENKSLKCSIVALLRSQIVTNCEQYNKLGYLPDYARYTINELGSNYCSLGGNHGIQDLITKTNNLPPIKEKSRA